MDRFEKAMKIANEIDAEWTDEDGLVTLKPDQKNRWSADNQILFTCHYILCLWKMGLLCREKIKLFDNLLSRCQRHFNGRVIAGLWNRNPGRCGPNDLQEHDDYTGIAALSSILKLIHHHNIVGFGRTYGWSFDNIAPFRWNPKVVHQGFLIAFYCLLGGFIRPWLLIWLLGSTITPLFHSKCRTSSKLLTVLRLEAICHKFIILKPLYLLWKLALRIRNKGGIPELYEIYFPGHPLVKLAKLVKF